MLALYLVLTIALPAVLQACCHPDQMSFVTYVAGKKGYTTTLVDFKQGRLIGRPVGDELGVLDYVLHDFNTKKSYTKVKVGGSCFISNDEESTMPQCIPKEAKSVGVNTLGNGLEVETFVMTVKSATAIMTVTKDTCLPVFNTVKFINNPDADVFPDDFTSIFANVTTKGLRLGDLHHDVSMCKPF